MMDPKTNGLAAKLHEIDRTPAWLARKAGISRPAVYRYVNGDVPVGSIPIESWLAICEAVDEDPREFYYCMIEFGQGDGE